MNLSFLLSNKSNNTYPYYYEKEFILTKENLDLLLAINIAIKD
jgi:hypothetical protein